MRAMALFMIVLGALPVAFVRPIVGLILWIGFSYMNPHRIAYGFATGFPWVMITAVVTLISIAINRGQRQPMQWTPLTGLLLLFLIWTGITTLTAVNGEMAQAKWIEFFKIQMMAFATLVLVTDHRRLHWILLAIVLSFGFWGFKGGLFTVLSGGSSHVLGPIKSFFRDNNQFALVMCMTLPMMRYLQLVAPAKWMRVALWFLIGLTVISILGTYSRGGFLGLGAIGVMLVLKSRKRAGLIVVGLMLLALGLSLMPQQWLDRMNTIDTYQQDSSATGRLDSWRFATNVALANPLTGGGFNVWASEGMWRRYGPPGATNRAIHSIYFQILGEQGFLGLILYLSLIGTGWANLWQIKKRARDRPDLRWMADLAAMLQVSMVGFLSAGAFLPMPYFDLFYQMLVLVVLLQVFLERALAQPAQDVEAFAETPSPKRGRRSAARGFVHAAPPRRSTGTGGLPPW